MRAILQLVLAVLLTACVHEQTFFQKKMASGDVQIARCDAHGTGLIGTIMETQNFSQCREYYRQQGWIEQ